MTRINDYKQIVGAGAIDDLKRAAEPLIGKHIVHINSTHNGGGVAEMLNSLLPLFNDLGVSSGWRVLKGNRDFFTITKSLHNALQGAKIQFSDHEKRMYEQVNRVYATYTHIDRHDCVVIHDPQPLALIGSYRKTQPWIWRCHIDISRPDHKAWQYLSRFAKRYDRIIVSSESFRRDLGIPHEVVAPSIDPLSEKNRMMSTREVNRELKKFGIPQDKPIISQVSRFDRWKDPLGVIAAFRIVREKHDCRLVLLGSSASDDPEGISLYEQVLDAARGDPDIHVINFESDLLVNALQRASSVVVQKSLREGFGLTVSEALWKGTPVVAGDAGGIGLQIAHGRTGYLITTTEECADSILRLLTRPAVAKRMGERGYEHVKRNFLITRHLKEYLHVFKNTVINYTP